MKQKEKHALQPEYKLFHRQIVTTIYNIEYLCCTLRSKTTEPTEGNDQRGD